MTMMMMTAAAPTSIKTIKSVMTKVIMTTTRRTEIVGWASFWLAQLFYWVRPPHRNLRITFDSNYSTSGLPASRIRRYTSWVGCRRGPAST